MDRKFLIPPIYLIGFLFFTTSACRSNQQSQSQINQTENLVTGTSEISPYDVSILFPYFDQNRSDEYIKGSDLSVLDQKAIIQDVLKSADPGGFDRKLFRADASDLIVTGLRLDPCFKKPSEPESMCERQIRLVVQEKGFNGIDRPFHLFFKISDENILLNTVQEIAKLRETLNIDVPKDYLGVHPAFKSPQRSQFFLGLKKIILSKISFKNLFKVTHVDSLGGSLWFFTSFEINHDGEEATKKEQKMAGVNVSGMTTLQFEARIPTEGGMNPEPSKNIAYILPLYNRTAESMLSQSGNEEEKKTALTTAVQNAYDIENPAKHSPDTVDCISCHVARQAIIFGAKKHNIFLAEEKKYQSINKLRPDPSFSSISLDLRNLRAFGYVPNLFESGKAVPFVSQRTANETSEVVALFNKKLGRLTSNVDVLSEGFDQITLPVITEQPEVPLPEGFNPVTGAVPPLP